MSAQVSMVRWTVGGGHAHMAIWNRGGLSGEIVVEARDAAQIAARLMPAGTTYEVALQSRGGPVVGYERRPG